ncbi:hypothetical protein [Mesorhizobium sp. A556]
MGRDLTSADYDGLGVSRAAAPTGGGLLPLALCYLGLALYMIFRHVLGLAMANDPDDLLKLHEIRTFIATGNVFDRTLPGILQPEPYVTHWPWIVDLPYALVAWLVMPFVGNETALSVATFTVPLLLLAPALYFYNRLAVASGFTRTVIALPLAVFCALQSFFEFAPGRIDYHNLEVLIFFAALALALSPRRTATVACGALVALGMAISLEFAVFHALVVGLYAFDFVFGRKDGRARIAIFGGALAVTALVLFAVIVPPSAYAVAKCDTYSVPYALALVLAGLTFAAAPLLASRHGPLLRAGVLVIPAMASMAVVAALFPLCLEGPYAGMDAHLRALVLDGIPQELSFFQRPDFVLSESFPAMMVLFVGALAPIMLCLVERRRERGLVLFALASLLALVQAIVYFRYLRYLPLFSGIGLLFVVAALLPPRLAAEKYAHGRFPTTTFRRLMLIVPGMALALLLALYHLSVKTAPLPVTAVDLAGYCGATPSVGRYDWPTGAVVLAPPLVGADLLAQPAGPVVVAIPNHPAAQGIERVHRFFDPATQDADSVLAETGANLVAVCAAPAGFAEAFRKKSPLAFMLMEGNPPSWLTQCPSGKDKPLRFYRRTEDADALCPTM